mgnify:CR=1 FL=1
MIDFNLMILAAGYGKRMKNLTTNKPKPLLKINDKELLSHNIDFFLNLGCNRIVINTHFLHEQIKYFINKNYANTNIQLVFEPLLLNTGGGIKNALSILGKKNFLVTNSDILWNKNNKKGVMNFIKEYQEVRTCKLLLAKNFKFKGLKKSIGDFKLENKLIERWVKNDPLLFYSGLQIINPNIFSALKEKCFSMNILWNALILNKQLEGKILNSSIFHVGDIDAYNNIINY